jgi:hypothetical protein
MSRLVRFENLLNSLGNMSASLQDTCFTLMLKWYEHVPSVTCCAIKFQASYICSDAIVIPSLSLTEGAKEHSSLFSAINSKQFANLNQI